MPALRLPLVLRLALGAVPGLGGTPRLGLRRDRLAAVLGTIVVSPALGKPSVLGRVIPWAAPGPGSTPRLSVSARLILSTGRLNRGLVVGLALGLLRTISRLVLGLMRLVPAFRRLILRLGAGAVPAVGRGRGVGRRGLALTARLGVGEGLVLVEGVLVEVVDEAVDACDLLRVDALDTRVDVEVLDGLRRVPAEGERGQLAGRPGRLDVLGPGSPGLTAGVISLRLGRPVRRAGLLRFCGGGLGVRVLRVLVTLDALLGLIGLRRLHVSGLVLSTRLWRSALGLVLHPRVGGPLRLSTSARSRFVLAGVGVGPRTSDRFLPRTRAGRGRLRPVLGTIPTRIRFVPSLGTSRKLPLDTRVLGRARLSIRRCGGRVLTVGVRTCGRLGFRLSLRARGGSLPVLDIRTGQRLGTRFSPLARRGLPSSSIPTRGQLALGLPFRARSSGRLIRSVRGRLGARLSPRGGLLVLTTGAAGRHRRGRGRLVIRLDASALSRLRLRLRARLGLRLRLTVRIGAGQRRCLGFTRPLPLGILARSGSRWGRVRSLRPLGVCALRRRCGGRRIGIRARGRDLLRRRRLGVHRRSGLLFSLLSWGFLVRGRRGGLRRLLALRLLRRRLRRARAALGLGRRPRLGGRLLRPPGGVVVRRGVICWLVGVGGVVRVGPPRDGRFVR
ncbi:hypothetical protein BJP25_01570 [Actinokineospora bangkokensis]|uniref:Uncharacterized protein n=1 Tax=Actinokineospora bangkokensis TaxID=1193682 RepID=A0A1Q9LCL0_9PSEU|nr:hypothetical protein BJP25_01570 [Actinokineospora bangkokensis]